MSLNFVSKQSALDYDRIRGIMSPFYLDQVKGIMYIISRLFALQETLRYIIGCASRLPALPSFRPREELQDMTLYRFLYLRPSILKCFF